MSNCTFSNNTPQNLGGGIYFTTSSDASLINCLVLNNNAVATGGGIYIQHRSDERFNSDKCSRHIWMGNAVCQ